MQKTIVLVGHCGPDMFLLRNAARRFVPEARIESANSRGELEPHLHAGALLLMNRVLDGGFGTTSGIELIREIIAGSDSGAAAMLISNFEDAQQQAIAAGAHRGFGKRDANDSRSGELIREALGG